VFAQLQSRVAGLLGPPGPRVGISYAVRVASAAAASMLMARLLQPQMGLWAVVSAVVVIQPDNRASLSAAALRVVANLVGASVGVAIGLVLGLHPFPAIVLAVVVVAGLCRALGLDAAARSANVSAAIVLLRGSEHLVVSLETRVLGVLAGCGIALAVTAVAVGIERARGAYAAAEEGPSPLP
jgi:uncharacterized membrane protein YgaE (UPF0421/DUF939 family)